MRDESRLLVYAMIGMTMIIFVAGAGKARAFTLDAHSFEQFASSSATAPVGDLIKNLKNKFIATDIMPNDDDISPNAQKTISPQNVDFDASIVISVAQKTFLLAKMVIGRLGLTFNDVVHFLVNGFMWVLQGTLRITDSLLSAALGN